MSVKSFILFSLEPGFHPTICIILIILTLNEEMDVYLETSPYLLQLCLGNCNIVLIIPHCRRDFRHDTNCMNTF